MEPTPSQPPSAIGTNLCSRLRMASLRSSEFAQSTCSYLVSAPPRWPRSFRVSSGSSSSGAAPYRGRPASGDRPVPYSLSNHAMIPGCRPIGGPCARGQHAGHSQARPNASSLRSRANASYPSSEASRERLSPFPGRVHVSAPGTFRPGRGPLRAALPPIGLTAADLFAGGKVLKGRFACTFTRHLLPVLVALRSDRPLTPDRRRITIRGSLVGGLALSPVMSP